MPLYYLEKLTVYFPRNKTNVCTAKLIIYKEEKYFFKYSEEPNKTNNKSRHDDKNQTDRTIRTVPFSFIYYTNSSPAVDNAFPN